MTASPHGPTLCASRPLALPYTLTGILTVPAGAQLVMNVHGDLCEVRLPDGTLLSLFPQAYVRPSRDDAGQFLGGDQLSTLDCLVDDHGLTLDAPPHPAIQLITLDDLNDLPPGPTPPAPAPAGVRVTAQATVHLPEGTTEEGGHYRLPTGEYVTVEVCLVQQVERGGIPLSDEQAEDLGCRLDGSPRLPLTPPF